MSAKKYFICEVIALSEIKICPSVLASDMLHLEDEIKRAESAGADILHLDVMDGVYVPNISFGFDVIRRIGSITDLPLDCHMMTVCPGKYLEVLRRAGASNVTIHLGLYSEDETAAILREIRDLGMSAAVSVKPGEDTALIAPYAELIDMALVMTVEPGFGGQKFMDHVLPKVREIKSLVRAAGRDIPVQTDGGIDAATVSRAAEAGSSMFVVGTASFGAPDMAEAVKNIRLAAESSYKD